MEACSLAGACWRGVVVKLRVSGQHFTKARKAVLGLWETGRVLGNV